MGLFAKNMKNPGWLSFSLQGENLCAAHVKRSHAAKPEVTLVISSHVEKSPAAGLGKLARELHAQRFQCTTLLASDEYKIMTVDAPNVPPDELKAAIRWRLKDMLDFHVDDATIDVLDIPVDKNSPSRAHSMYAVAARNQLIEQRQALFGEAKIPLSVIDIPEMAQRNFSALLEPEGRGVALLSFDDVGGLLTVSFRGELYLTRHIEVSLPQISGAHDMQSAYDRITLELQRSLDHFDRQYNFVAVSKLILAPMGVAAQGLKEHLAANMYMPIEVLDLEAVLDISKVPDLQLPENQQHYFMALGAALRIEEKAL
jgi:MSHA biogenesis protein MshI